MKRSKHEKIQRLKRRRKSLLDELSLIQGRVKDAAEDGGDVSTDLADRVSAIEQELAEIQDDIADLQGALETESRSASPDFRGISYAQARKELAPGERIARMAISLVGGRLKGENPAAYAEARWGTDDTVERALSAGVVGAGGVTIPTVLVAELIEQLLPASVIRSSSPVVLGIPAGNANIPRLDSGAGASYQGEMDDIATSEQTFDEVSLAAKKLMALVPISNDLVRRSVIGIEELVRRDIIDRVTLRQDLAFIRGDGANKTPVGIRNQAAAANIMACPAGQDPQTVAFALGEMLQALEGGNVKMLRPVWLMSSRTKIFLQTLRNALGQPIYEAEILRGELLGYPIKITNQIPNNLGAGGNETELMLVDMSEVIIGDALDLTLDVSTEASFIDAKSGSLVSAYSKDLSVLRAITEHDLGLRHREAAAVLTGVTWQSVKPVAA